MSEETTLYQVGKDEEANKPMFAESTIRAVAERSWWRKTPKKTIAKYNYLTEEEVDELRATPEYREYVEKIMFERRSAGDFETWVESYGDTMPQCFGEHMGLDPKVVPDMVKRVRQAHHDQDLDKTKVNLLWKQGICDDEILKKFPSSLTDKIKDHLEWLHETEKRHPNLKEEI